MRVCALQIISSEARKGNRRAARRKRCIYIESVCAYESESERERERISSEAWKGNWRAARGGGSSVCGRMLTYANMC